MSEKPAQPGASDRPALKVDQIKGPAVFVVQPPPEDPVPEDQARRCPQCKRMTWSAGRFCHLCMWDFDRAALPRCHPTKLFAISVSINLLLIAGMLACALTQTTG